MSERTEVFAEAAAAVAAAGAVAATVAVAATAAAAAASGLWESANETKVITVVLFPNK